MVFESAQPSILGLTAEIVSSHVTNNIVDASMIPVLIQSIYRSLASAGVVKTAPAEAQMPAVPIKKSIFPDYIVCLEDGRKMKTLKRHLENSFGLSPADYRAKWALPHDYPMVAPNYAATRSSLAKQNGLGRKAAAEPMVEPIPARRARGAKG